MACWEPRRRAFIADHAGQVKRSKTFPMDSSATCSIEEDGQVAVRHCACVLLGEQRAELLHLVEVGGDVVFY